MRQRRGRGSAPPLFLCAELGIEVAIGELGSGVIEQFHLREIRWQSETRREAVVDDLLHPR